MARRRGSVSELFLMLPWWVSVIAAIVCYALMTYGVPSLFAGNPYNAVLVSVSTTFAPFVAAGLAVIAAATALRSFLISRKFNRQSGIADIRNLSWQQFEMLVGEAFRRRGYSVIENGGGGADGGVDLVLQRDGKKIFVQCKQWKVLNVGVKPVRELFGVISARRAQGGIFVNSGTYTKEAMAFAAQCGIQLIDGFELETMVKEVQQPQPFIEPTNWGNRSNTTFGLTDAAPSCPKCGKVMVLRAAKRGAKAGSQFWGCSGFPGCLGTREV